MSKLSIDFKVDGKVMDSAELEEFAQSSFHKHHAISYTTGHFEVDSRHIDFGIRIELPKNVAEELKWK